MDFYPSGIFLQTKSMSYSIIFGIVLVHIEGAKGTKEWEDDIAFIKTTYDISLDFGKSLLPRGFSPA